MVRSRLFLCLTLLAPVAFAGPDDFHAGALIKDYGAIAPVPDAKPLPADTRFKLAIDVAREDLLDGVEITFSATTTHVLLQQQGFAQRP